MVCLIIIIMYTNSHSIQSGIWSRDVLAYYEGQGYTIRDAIHYWYWNISDTDEGVAFRDVCTGPHCSNACPEEILLSAEIAETWSEGARIAIAVIVLTIAVICLLLKVNSCKVTMFSVESNCCYCVACTGGTIDA